MNFATFLFYLDQLSIASISYRYGAWNTPKRKKIDRWIGELNGRMNNGPARSVKKIIEWETRIFIAPRGCCASIKPEWKRQVSLSLSLFSPPLPFFPFPFSFLVGVHAGCDRIPIGGRAFAIHVSRDLCNIGQWTTSNFALGFTRSLACYVGRRSRCDRTFAVDASTMRVESSIYRENVSKGFFFKRKRMCICISAFPTLTRRDWWILLKLDIENSWHGPFSLILANP